MQQLILNVERSPHATFNNFIAKTNRAILTYLQQTQDSLVLFTPSGEGLTHLLQAICHQTEAPTLYLPLQAAKQLDPSMLNGAEQLALIVIDDVDAIMGDQSWERALFNAFNASQITKTRLLFGCHTPASFNLRDLHSRLQSLNQIRLQPLTDAEKAAILQQQAEQRGFYLTPKVIDYLLHTKSRDLKDLLALLAKAAVLSLQTQRRITLPLMKQLLELA